MVLEPPYLAEITDVDRGLSKILSNFGTGALVCLLIGFPIAGSLWWFRISGFVPVVPDPWVSSCGPGCLKPFPWSWNPLYLAEITDMDRGLSEILSKFGTGALVHLLIGLSVAGSLWWFWISRFVPVDLDI